MKSSIKLFYDEKCPFCVWYSGILVRYHFLNVEDRVSYQLEAKKYNNRIDLEKATTKIACYDETEQTVYYGVDSLIFILSSRLPNLMRIAKFQPVYWILTQLYSFISYNRKIIFPSKDQISCACTPQKNWFWRILFIGVLIFVTSLLVQSFFNRWFAYSMNNHPFPDWSLLILQLFFQGTFFALFKQTNLYDYLGHLTFVSFVGSLFLAVMGIGLHWLTEPMPGLIWLAPVAYGIVFWFMFTMHQKRLKHMQWNQNLSYTWLVFRFLIYPLVFTI
jgi:predicted DCC family thiol-disulfide oxidoreductase YuxK